MAAAPQARCEELDKERNELLAQLEDWLETPMVVLGFVWLALLVVDLTRGLSPLLDGAATVIWAIFIFDFAVKLLLAPHKLDYLKDNWLTVMALVLPALRVFRIVRVVRVFRLARTARGLRLVRFVTSMNRGVRALRVALGRRGFGYVMALSAIVMLAGAAGMYAFESVPEGGGLRSYSEALWWTAMMMTTLGSDYWPRTAEGRVLCFLLALYAFSVFGYVTATLATFFLGRDAAGKSAEPAGAESVEGLRREIEALRAELRSISASGSQMADRRRAA